MMHLDKFAAGKAVMEIGETLAMIAVGIVESSQDAN
jgi:hypothetical protein